MTTTPPHSPGDELRDIDQALWLLASFRGTDREAVADVWFQEELSRFLVGRTEEEVSAELARVVNGFVHLSSLFLDVLVDATQRDPEEIIADCRAQIEQNLRDVTE
jgi:hypothetical protein